MLEFFLHALRADPEIAVFLAIALGVFVGRIHIGSFHLGSLIGLLSTHIGMIPVELGIGGGVLVAALVIGWYNSRTRKSARCHRRHNGPFPSSA